MLNLQDRPPLAEMAKRAAEAGGGLAAAAKAVALGNFATESAAARQRVHDSHVLRNKLLGGDPKEEPADMGTIIVTGDLYGDQAVRAIQAATGATANAATPEAVPPQPTQGVIVKALPYLLAAAIGGGGVAAVPWIAQLFTRPAATDTDTVTNVEIEAWKPSP